jgi:hypothetical protein
VESSCERGNEPSGSMKCWELSSDASSTEYVSTILIGCLFVCRFLFRE